MAWLARSLAISYLWLQTHAPIDILLLILSICSCCCCFHHGGLYSPLLPLGRLDAAAVVWNNLFLLSLTNSDLLHYILQLPLFISLELYCSFDLKTGLIYFIGACFSAGCIVFL